MDHEVKIAPASYVPAEELTQRYGDYFRDGKLSFIKDFAMRKVSHANAYMISVLAGEPPEMFWSPDKTSLIHFQSLTPDQAQPFRLKLDELYEGSKGYKARKRIAEKALQNLSVELQPELMRT